METLDLVKAFGPLALGWVVAFYLMKFILDRYDKDIDSRNALASALNNLSKIIEQSGRNAG